ncbi:MAG: ABC transporter permease [Oscillibacter sp.]|nr:ABC transporter permease [Oscillibacter sp.]
MKNKKAALLSHGILIITAVVLSVLLILSVGSDLGAALGGFARGAFGSAYSIAEVLVKAAPLTLCGLSVAVGFHSGFTNIGAEGQFYIGATIATYIGMYWTSLPTWLLLPAAILFGFLGGGIWAAIPGVLRAKFGISEVINTIMFNYIAAGIVGILLQTSLKSPDAYFPVSSYVPEEMWLPTLIPGTRLHAGLIVALVCAALVYVLIWRSWTGYRIRAVGLNPRACECAGIPVSRSIILSSLVGGGLAGLAGVCEIAGLQHRLLDGISPGYGYLAIVAALLGRNSPWGVVLASVGIAAIQVGAQGMQRSAGVPTAIANIILGCVVLLILGRRFLETHLRKGA